MARLVRLWMRAGGLARAGRAAEAFAAWRRLGLEARELLGGLPQSPRVLAARALAVELADLSGGASQATLADGLADGLATRLIENLARLRPDGQCGNPQDAGRARSAAKRLLIVLLACLLLGGALLFAVRYSAQARLARTQADLAAIGAFLSEAGRASPKLEQLTGNGCSDCPCKERGPLPALPKGDVCRTNWDKALRAAYRALHGREPGGEHGEDLIPSRWKRDAWGGPYLLDENAETLRSAGPDGIPGTADDLVLKLGSLRHAE